MCLSRVCAPPSYICHRERHFDLHSPNTLSGWDLANHQNIDPLSCRTSHLCRKKALNGLHTCTCIVTNSSGKWPWTTPFYTLDFFATTETGLILDVEAVHVYRIWLLDLPPQSLGQPSTVTVRSNVMLADSDVTLVEFMRDQPWSGAVTQIQRLSCIKCVRVTICVFPWKHQLWQDFCLLMQSLEHISNLHGSTIFDTFLAQLCTNSSKRGSRVCLRC